MIDDQEIVQIHKCRDCGMSQRKAAEHTGLHRRTVRKYWGKDPVAKEFRKTSRPNRQSSLEEHREYLEQQFVEHRENCDVVRQVFARDKGVKVPLRTLQDFLKPCRDRLAAERLEKVRAGSRIETVPGDFLQIDFGTQRIMINEVETKVSIFVATLGYSRRHYVEVYEDERQDRWLKGVENAFAHFQGITRYILCDNAKALVTEAGKAEKRDCTFNPRFKSFCDYWKVVPIACLPYNPQCKGKVEAAVKYVKKNGLAGYSFQSLEQVNEHLKKWLTEVADKRVMKHLDRGEEPVPIQRFELEKPALRELPTVPSFLTFREGLRTVSAKGLLTVDSCHYRLPKIWIGIEVRVLIGDKEIQVFSGTQPIATFDRALDAIKHTTIRRMVNGSGEMRFGATESGYAKELTRQLHPQEDQVLDGELQRPLAVYEDAVGGPL